MTRFLSASLVIAAVSTATLSLTACGKRGAPLPPLVRMPVAPATLLAERRGPVVSLRVAVPGQNTDGSSPADITRVEVYALNGPAVIAAAEVVNRGRLIRSWPVNPPEDPDAPPDTPKPTVPGGVDQGATAEFEEPIREIPGEEVRAYAAIGISRRGRRGPVSRTGLASLAAAPAPPAPVSVRYTDKVITVEWPAPESSTATAFNVYEVKDPETRLTSDPLDARVFEDTRVEWDVERCYVVRSVATAEGLRIESAGSPPACVTFKDTFPPSAPTGLQTVPEAGAVSLIWNAVDDPNLAGYLVLRAIAPSTDLVAITNSPITETTFRDTVGGGQRVTYAVQAVDKSGNVSPASERREETPR